MAVSRLMATVSEETWAYNGDVKDVASIPTHINNLVIKFVLLSICRYLNKKYYQRIDFYKISNSLFFNLYP